MTEKYKATSFLLILMSSFFILLIYSMVLGPKSRQQNRKTQETEIILAGDTMLGRSVMTKSLGLNNPSYSFEKVKDDLLEADLVFLNLENPVIKDCPASSEGMIFCAKPEMIQGLVSSGVDVVTLANNHTSNYGKSGLQETVGHLTSANILSTGLGRLSIKEQGVLKFGFLGFDFFSKAPTDADYKLISESKEKVDFLLVGVHWGAEYMSKPSQFQKTWATKIIENGADVIAGHGSHWVQDVDYIDGVPVYYSLGNFVFDQMWSEKTREGMIVRLELKGTDIQKEELLPIYMSSWAQPELLSH